MADSIFVIGNGFDLNLGLKTSYKDFIESSFFAEHRVTNHLFGYLHEKGTLQNWIDVEHELATYSALPRRKVHESFFENYKILCDALSSYIQSINSELINTDSHAYKFIENKFQANTRVINFNYTNTVEVILNMAGIAYDPGRIIYTHADRSDNSIIFGVQDGADINKADSFLYKSASFKYNKKNLVFRDLFINSDDIHIFGHSLGEADYSYFRDFFMYAVDAPMPMQKPIYIYHYGEQGWHGIVKHLQYMTSDRLGVLRNHNRFKTIDVSN